MPSSATTSSSSAAAPPAPPPPSCSPRPASPSTSSRSSRTWTAARLRHHPAGQRPARPAPARRVGRGTQARATRFDTLGLRAPTRRHRCSPSCRTSAPAARTCPPRSACTRPTWPRILVDRAAAAGAKVRFGTTIDALEQDADGVDVRFTDGATGRYDLVIGADGVRSATRARARHRAGRPEPTGMGIWRAFVPRPGERRPAPTSYYGGPCYIAGYCPTGEDTLYAYLVEDAQDRSSLDPRTSSWR